MTKLKKAKAKTSNSFKAKSLDEAMGQAMAEEWTEAMAEALGEATLWQRMCLYVWAFIFYYYEIF